MKTILFGLNELNFEYITPFTKGLLPNFKNIFTNSWYRDQSEDEYELLEP